EKAGEYLLEHPEVMQEIRARVTAHLKGETDAAPDGADAPGDGADAPDAEPAPAPEGGAA
ncbi:MAG: hypothetical protein RI554_05605, partial [Trueperaceae bacterium]|nr:hypothetical protein [Trueperaceae bacterium]